MRLAEANCGADDGSSVLERSTDPIRDRTFAAIADPVIARGMRDATGDRLGGNRHVTVSIGTVRRNGRDDKECPAALAAGVNG